MDRRDMFLGCQRPLWPVLPGCWHPSVADIQIWLPHWCLCEFPEATEGAFRIAISTICSYPWWFTPVFIVTRVHFPGSKFSWVRVLVRKPQAWLSSTVSLWSMVKSHMHYQKLNVGHGSYCTLPLLSALPFPSNSLSNWTMTDQLIYDIRKHPTGEWGGSRDSISSQRCTSRMQMTPEILSSWFLYSYKDQKQVAEMKFGEVELDQATSW